MRTKSFFIFLMVAAIGGFLFVAPFSVVGQETMEVDVSADLDLNNELGAIDNEINTVLNEIDEEQKVLDAAVDEGGTTFSESGLSTDTKPTTDTYGIKVYVEKRSQGYIPIYVQAPPETSEVRLFYRKGEDPNENFLGNASLVKRRVWLYKWYITSATPGHYFIFPRIRLKGEVITDSPVSVVIEKKIPLPPVREDFESDDERRDDDPDGHEIEIEDDDDSVDIARDIEKKVQLIEEAKEEFEATHGEVKDEIKKKVDEFFEEKLNDIDDFEEKRTISEKKKEALKSIDKVFEEEKKELRDILRDEFDITDEDKTDSLFDELQKSLSDFVDRELSSIDGASDSLDELFEELDAEVERLREKIAEKEKLVKERAGLSVFLDSDADGVSDYDEIYIYKTDPLISDSDNDGVLDGEEVAQGRNPLRDAADRDDSVEYEDPRTAIAPEVEALTVDDIVVLETAEKDKEKTASKILITGRALPNSFVTIFIYSEPVRVTVKTNVDGVWSYELAKELPDGRHEIYVVTADNTGRVIAKSPPVPFVKQAAAIRIGEEAVSGSAENELSFLNSRGVMFSAAGGVILLLILLAFLGYRHGRHKDDDDIFITGESK